MAHIFVIAGHGAGDSGATGGGYTEAERVRALASKIGQYGGNNVTIGDTSRNWYADNGISSLNISKDWQIIELHMDSASASARGGHVIINSTFEPDDYDNALANFISKKFPGRSQSIVKRSDLANPKRAAAKGYPYRLVECGFISNATDREIFNSDIDEIAKGILECFSIKSSGSSSPSSSTNTNTSNSASSSSSNNCLGNGDSGSDVRELQQMLIACGYSCGSCGADGIFGDGTESAVRNFQSAYGLTVDGLAGVNTMAKLKSVYASRNTSSNWIAQLQEECNRQGFSNQKVDGIAGPNTLAGCPTLRRGAKGNITKIMQQRLISLGYSCGSNGADGDFGSGTESGVKKYQKAKGLSKDGIVGQNTWRKLLGL